MDNRNSPAIDIKDYLLLSADSTLALDYETNVFIGSLPDLVLEPVLGIFDSGGSPPEPNDIENPIIQLLVRGKPKGYDEARDFMANIVSVLHTLANTTINSTSYIVIWKITDIIHVNTDQKFRPLFSCSLRVQRS